MTAILNFTLPNLEVPAGKAATTDASSSELRLKASEGATTGSQGVADKGNEKEFSKLLNDRFVKKETAKQGIFDGSGQPDPETTEQSEAIPSAAAILPGDPAESIEIPPGSNRKAIELRLRADPEPVKADAVTTSARSDAVKSDAILASQPLNTETESSTLAGKTGITRASGEQIALARSTARGPILQAVPTASQISVTSLTVSEDPVSQARATAPVHSDDLPTTISLNAERSADSQSPKGLPPAAEAEELLPEQLRQQRPVAADALSRTGRRADGAVAGGNSEAEFAAWSGKELPDSGKPLPSVLTQTPAQYAPGLSGRAEIMTRSVGNGRQRSTGKQAVEVPGLEKAAAANSGLPLSEMFAKAVNQIQPVASTETGMHAQSTSSDPQATGLLAQALAGVDKVGSTRAASQLTGPDANNTLSLQLQPGSQDMSAQLGSRI
ncbi:MAG: hypothetical protein KJN90_12265, partial [Gammaproteobacteria bacterium]|nr:hypothetical protein [Gammaproteobacteria bacterium]